MSDKKEPVSSLRQWGAIQTVKKGAQSGDSGYLCAIRISFSKHGSQNDNLPDLSASLLDAAVFAADSSVKKINVTRWDSGAFILAEFQNEVTAEIEINLGLPKSMPGIYFVTAFCSEGIITNQPLTGYFNPGGVLQADENSCKTLLVDRDICEDEIEQAKCRAASDGIPPVSHEIIDLLKEFFQ